MIGGQSGTIGRYSFGGLQCAIALAPLPFASVYPWIWSGWAVLMGVLLLGWCADIVSGGAEPVSRKMTVPLVWPFLAVLAWALFQISPFAPAAWQHPLWIEASKALHQPLQGTVALDPETSMGAITRLCTYAAIFWLAVQYGRDPARAKRALTVVAVSGVVYAVYGLIVQLSGAKSILWYPKIAYIPDLTSTFINKNNYATYAGLACLCSIALFYDAFTKNVGKFKTRAEAATQIITFIEKGGWRYITAIIVLVSSMLYSHSRAGFVSTVIGIMTFSIALTLGKSTRERRNWRLGAVLMGLLFALFIGNGHVIDERIASIDLSVEERPRVYALTLKAIGDQPLLGSGLGSFEEVFRFYRTADLKETFTLAHETYLETALELGIPATILLIGLPIFTLGVNIYGALTRRRDTIYPCLGLAATVLVGVHSLIDFSIQIPAVAMTYALLAGIGYSQSWSSRQTSVFN
jgi:O-antigen ligase